MLVRGGENRGWSVHTRLNEQMPIRQATAYQISDRTCVSADANSKRDTDRLSDVEK